MDKSKALEKVFEYTTLVCQSMKPQKVVLYGSYAKGNWREESDIDIAIVVDTIEGDFLDAEALLYRLRRNIDDKIEPVLLEEKCDESGFLNEILKYGQIIYSV
jgi:uncharacterized protein